MKNKGFTLIELLIVITLLGILAVAVLSAINPIEQINRSKDTASQGDSEQLINAIERFYATAGYYPWRTDPNDEDVDGSDGVTWTQVTAEAPTDGQIAMLTKLSSEGTGEIKESFATRIVQSTSNALWLYNKGTPGSSTYVCFEPKSQRFKTNAENRCGTTLPGTTFNFVEDVWAATPLDFPVAEACDGTEIYSCLP